MQFKLAGCETEGRTRSTRGKFHKERKTTDSELLQKLHCCKKLQNWSQTFVKFRNFGFSPAAWSGKIEPIPRQQPVAVGRALSTGSLAGKEFQNNRNSVTVRHSRSPPNNHWPVAHTLQLSQWMHDGHLLPTIGKASRGSRFSAERRPGVNLPTEIFLRHLSRVVDWRSPRLGHKLWLSATVSQRPQLTDSSLSNSLC